jgi:predicted metal-binding membrane protein
MRGVIRHAFPAVMALLLATMWAALLLWQASPYGRYLEHGWTSRGLAASLCAALPAGAVLVPLVLYAGGWLLMASAMMLPTVAPLLTLFRRLTADRADRNRLLLLVVAGYLAMWAAFGVAAFALDLAVATGLAQAPWLGANAWAPGAAVLALAGLYQFSAWKYRCLDKCRTPLSFVVGRWRGGPARRQAFALGLEHGAFCVGCCWALMLLMFVVGTGNLGVMLGLGAIMAAEKNLAWGRKLSQPLGAALIAWATMIVVQATLA